MKAVDVGAVLALVILAAGIYGRYATKGGWFYDDWSIYSLLRDQHGGFFAELHACARSIPGGRTLACAYHSGEYSLFGAHRTEYQFAAIAFLAFDATLFYIIARRCGLARLWALLLGLALILFPASDSSRLWAVAAIGQYVVALVLIANLTVLSALRRTGPSAIVLHFLSAALVVLAMMTYEIALPLVAIGGCSYYLTYRDRRAIVRWALDILLIVFFLIYRVVIVPVSNEAGLVVHRTVSQTLERADALIGGAWTTWKFVYLPGALGTVALVVLIVVSGSLMVRSRDFARKIVPWLLLLAIGIVLSLAGVLVYLTANDLYIPQVSGTFNRLNLPGSFGYVSIAIALLGISYRMLVTLKVPSNLGVCLIVLTVAGSTVHQLGVSADHIRSWEASWRDQQQALSGYRVALRGLPRVADVIGFDTPIWEHGYVPVFSASWDLRGALDYETSVDPAVAYPLLPTLTCGSRGVMEGVVVVAPYDATSTPLYFASPKRRMAIRISTASACESVIARWGRPPFWGSTVTGN